MVSIYETFFTDEIEYTLSLTRDGFKDLIYDIKYNLSSIII